MAAKKKGELTKEADTTNLRRSSRSTRGSVKPIVDLAKEIRDEEEVIEPEVEDDSEFEVTAAKVKRESARKSTTTRRASTKKEPVRKAATGRKSAVKQEKASTSDEPVKSEPFDDIPEDDKDLGNVEDDDGIYYELNEVELKEINHAFDMNRVSDEEELLNADGLRTAIRSLGFEPRGDEIKKLLKAFAKKGNRVTRDGFHKIMALKYGSSPGTKLNNLNDEISRVFNLLDLDKTGLITVDNLKSIAKELNEDLTEEELHEMIGEADLDGDSKINKQEFQNIMVKTSLY